MRPYNNIAQIKRSKISRNTSKQGEPIEQKMARLKTSKQPIKEGIKPIIYQDRNEGIHPGFNIKTNKMEVALEATDALAKARQAKRSHKPQNGKPESTDGTQNDAGGEGTTGKKD